MTGRPTQPPLTEPSTPDHPVAGDAPLAPGHAAPDPPPDAPRPAADAPVPAPTLFDDDLPAQAWWVALAGLPGMGPARLRALWEAGSGQEAWTVVADGRAHLMAELGPLLGRTAEETSRRWARTAASLDVAARWRDHAAVSVSVLGDATHPLRLADDVEPPVVLFASGHREVLAGPTVAIVGTRRCTRPGAEMAHQLGLACAQAGVTVVSGLAVGIDSAAHRGALAAGGDGAPPVAVVGSGLDVVYPARSRSLWYEVAARGAVLSEYPLGTEPARWRFPARNRLVAALADVVVVVESPRSGGSMYTVDEALRRDRKVLAVPGSVRSAASAGTNWLLSQGAEVACEPDDVLAALGLAGAGADQGTLLDPRPKPTGDGRRVLRALGWEPATLDVLARRTGLALATLAVAVDGLESDRWVDRDGGRIERRAAP